MLVLFFACGSDTATNQTPGTGEEVIFSMDSFAINLENTLTAKDTNIVLSDAPNVKINFNCSTNADSVNSFAFFRLISGDSSHLFLDSTISQVSLLNRDYSFVLSGSKNFSLNVVIQANRISNVSCFIKLSNLRIYKLN